MKKYILVIIISLFWLNDVFAQKLYPLSVGLGSDIRSGLNISLVPQGRKLDMNISVIPDFSGSVYLPYSLDYNIGTLIDMSYSTIGHTMKDEVSGGKYESNISYLALSSSIYLEGFVAGLELGFPMSSSVDGDFNEGSLSSVIYSIRLGAMISILENEGGRLTFNALGNFMLNNVYEDYVDNDPLRDISTIRTGFPITEQHNPRVFSLSLGITYFFNINY